MNNAVTDREIGLMAAVLRRRFADGAPGMAGTFAAEHRLVGDEARARQWDRVGAELRRGGNGRTLS